MRECGAGKGATRRRDVSQYWLSDCQIAGDLDGATVPIPQMVPVVGPAGLFGSRVEGEMRAVSMFRRAKPNIERPSSLAEGASRPDVSRSDFEAAEALMDRFENVRGNGSDQDLADVLEKFGVLGGGRLALGWNRPWAWWTTIAIQAQQEGNSSLAVKVFNFGVDFNEHIGPKLPNAFCLGVGYGVMERDEYRRLAAVGLDALRAMQAKCPDRDFGRGIADAEWILRNGSLAGSR